MIPPEERSSASAGSPDTRRRFNLILTAMAVFLFWSSLYLYVPTLPVYAQTKTSNLALVGVILSMYGLWQAIIRLPLGIAADWLGRRKPFIIAGLVLSAIGASVMALASGARGLIVGRAITGLAAGTWVPLVAVFSSLFPPQDAVRASALLTLVASSGRALSSTVTGSLNNLGGYSLPFWLAAAAAVLAAVAILPTSEARRPGRQLSLRAISRLIIRRDVLLPAALQAVGQYANWTSTFGFLPVLAKEVGATEVALSLLVGLNIGVVVLGNLLATAIVKRVGTRNLLYASFVLMACGVAGAALARSVAVIVVAQSCIGLGQGLSYPLLMGLSIRDVDDGQRTIAMGLHQAVYAIGMFGGPWLSGILADAMGIRPTFLVTAVACLVIGLIGTQAIRARPQDVGAK